MYSIILGKKKNILSLSLFLIYMFILISIPPYDNFLIKGIFALCSYLCISESIKFCFDFKVNSLKDFVLKNKYVLLIILIGIYIFNSLLVSNFYFYDEYWMFTGETTSYIPLGLNMGRLFQGFLAGLVSFVQPNNMYITRWIPTLFAIIFCLVLYTWMAEKSKNNLLAFFGAIIICYTSAMVDSVAYAAIISYTFGIAMASLSVVAFDKSLHYMQQCNKVRGIYYLLISIFMIYGACQAYQLALPIIFLMFAIQVYYSDDRKYTLKFFFSYILLIVLAALAYKISNDLMSQMMGVEINGRSAVINSIEDILGKIKWFFYQVLPATINRVAAIFGGNVLYSNKNFWYLLQYKSGIKPLIVQLPIIILTIMGVLSYRKMKKSWLEVIFLLLCIPASYFVYLLLAENGYHTYYAYPLISLILLYMILGIVYIFNRIKSINKTYYMYIILGVMTIIGTTQANIYINRFWIYENKTSYDYIKNSLMRNLEQNNTDKIHIYGVPNFGQANIYSKFATDIILKELGKKPEDYQITVSDNEYYISVIEAYEMDEGCQKLSEEENERLKSYYKFGETYQQYYVAVDGNDLNILQDLRMLLTKAQMLPQASDNIITVDLTWVKPMFSE